MKNIYIASTAIGFSVLLLTGCGPLPPGFGDTRTVNAGDYFSSGKTNITHSLVDTRLNKSITVEPGAYVFHEITYASRKIPEVKMDKYCEAVSNYSGNDNYHIHPGRYQIELVRSNPVTHTLEYGINWGMTPDLGGPVDNWLFILPNGQVAPTQRFLMQNNMGWDTWPGAWILQPKGCRFTVINGGRNIISNIKVYYMGRTNSGLLQFAVGDNGQISNKKVIVPAQPGRYSLYDVNIDIIKVSHYKLTYKLDDEGSF